MIRPVFFPCCLATGFKNYPIVKQLEKYFIFKEKTSLIIAYKNDDNGDNGENQEDTETEESEVEEDTEEEVDEDDEEEGGEEKRGRK